MTHHTQFSAELSLLFFRQDWFLCNFADAFVIAQAYVLYVLIVPCIMMV
jgi:hypothetical protein